MFVSNENKDDGFCVFFKQKAQNANLDPRLNFSKPNQTHITRGKREEEDDWI